ncbi:hypothetical protein GCM10023238_14280 [Streptomyces heliomycini]
MGGRRAGGSGGRIIWPASARRHSTRRGADRWRTSRKRASSSSGSTRTGTGPSPPPEFKAALAQGGDWNVTESVAEAVIRSQDLNGDKVLSFDEFWTHLNK